MVERGAVYPKSYFSALIFHGWGDKAIPVLIRKALLVPHDTEMGHWKLCLLCFAVCLGPCAPECPGC